MTIVLKTSQGISLIYSVVQLVQKAVKGDFDTSISTLMFIFIGLACLIRALEIAIDAENYLNIISPGARACLYWLVISGLLIAFA